MVATTFGLVLAGPINANRRWLSRDRAERQFRALTEGLLIAPPEDIRGKWYRRSNSSILNATVVRNLSRPVVHPSDLRTAYETAALVDSISLFGQNVLSLRWVIPARTGNARLTVDRIFHFNESESEPELLLFARIENQ